MPDLGLPNLQGIYDSSAGSTPLIQLDSTVGALTIYDDAAPIGDILKIADSGGTDFFNLDPAQLNYGTAANRDFEMNVDATGRGGIRFLPDGRTTTTTPTQTYALQWDSTIIADIPGGAPFGNDTAPAMVGAIGECRFDDPGNLFSSSLLFNQATIVTANGVNVGPIYTMVNQPTMRTGTLGGSRTVSQHNALRIQSKWGPNVAGNLTQTSCEYIFFTATVDATVGTVGVTTMNYMAAKDVTLTAGGTIGTLNVLDIQNISGPTTIRGINSLMSNGTFINHTGTAPSVFTASNFRFNDNVGVELGTGQDVLLNWNASAFEWDPAVGDDLRIAFAAGTHTVTTSSVSTTAEILFGHPKGAFGQTSSVGNQKYLFVANAETISVGGEFSQFLLTQAANDTIDAALSLYAGWTINAPTPTIGTGSLVTGVALNIGGNPTGTTNRVGLRIISNPAGGSGINAALWVTAGSSRFDGRVDINNGVALGGGAAATLGAIGGSGPTATAQSQWLEIDIGGTPHWIAVWV